MNCPTCGDPIPPGRECSRCQAASPGESTLVVRLGRDPSCEIRLPEHDTRLSALHARVHVLGGRRFRIVDAGSTNGVSVNGLAVQTAEFGLEDRVQLGSYEFDTALLLPYASPPADGPHDLTADAHRDKGQPLLIWGLAGLVVLVALAIAWALAGRQDVAQQGNAALLTAPDKHGYMVVSEAWDGDRLVRQSALLENVQDGASGFEFVLRAATWRDGTTSVPFAVAGSSIRVTAREDANAPLNLSSVYGAVASRILQRPAATAGSTGTMELVVPQGHKVEALGRLPVSFEGRRLTHSGANWHQVHMRATKGPIRSLVAGSEIPTAVAGVFVWDEARTRLAIADLTVSREHDGVTVWSRVIIQALDPALNAAALLAGSGYERPGQVRRTRGAVSDETRVELAMLSRTALLDGGARAEQAHNPIFLAALAAIHLADSAWTLGANLAHDLHLRSQGIDQPINPFDSDIESPLEKYVYRNISRGVASLGSQLGLVDPENVETHAYHGGKILRIVGGIASTAGASIGHGLAQGGAHVAHVAWGHAAHAAGPAQHALVGLGKVAYYGSRDMGKAIDVAGAAKDLVDTASSLGAMANTASGGPSPSQQSPPTAHPQAPPTPGTSPAPAAMTTPGFAAGGRARILVVLDRSGSMKERSAGTAAIEEARRAVKLVAEVLASTDELGLVAFNDSAEVARELAPMGGHLAEFASTLGRINATGGTSFEAALRTAALLAERAGAPPLTILMVSDGRSKDDVTAVLARLGRTNANLHAIPVGQGADRAKLCAIAHALEGWCVSIGQTGIKQALIQVADESRGLATLAEVRDVIRPGEVQSIQLELPTAGSTGAQLQVVGTWQGSDLAFAARSPSGRSYSTDRPAAGSTALGSAAEAFRVLRVPFEGGSWTFEAHGRDVPNQGEAYGMRVSSTARGLPRLRALSDSYAPGQTTEIVLEACRGGQATLHGPGGQRTDLNLTPAPHDRCKATIRAPDQPGYFAVALRPRATTGQELKLWATLPVGSPAQAVATRARWRPDEFAWMTPADSDVGASYLMFFLLFGVGFVLLIGLLVFRRQASPAGGGRHDNPKNTSPPGQGGPVLVVTMPGGPPARFPLAGERVRLGRSPDNDIIIDQPEVSRYHLEFVRSGASWSLLNLADASGVVVEGAAIVPGRIVPCRDGAPMRLAGSVIVTFHDG